MESQKIKSLLDHEDETYSKYQAKKWYIINDRSNGQYDEGNGKGIKIDTEVVKLFYVIMPMHIFWLLVILLLLGALSIQKLLL